MPFIDLNDKEKQKPIYRYIDFYRVIQMFKNKELVFTLPKLWDDPFESYIIDSDIKHSINSKSYLQYKYIVHGSCWTRKTVSDAMWRIYSPHKMAVRIKTKPILLGNMLESALKKYPRSSWYIGKVQYLTQKKILEIAKSYVEQLDSENRDIIAAKSLLIKRRAFSHEQEVRVIIIDRHRKSNKGILKIKLNPYEIIQSILIDSRAPDELLDVYSNYLKNELKYNGRISKSILYKPLTRLIVNKYPI